MLAICCMVFCTGFVIGGLLVAFAIFTSRKTYRWWYHELFHEGPPIDVIDASNMDKLIRFFMNEEKKT